VASGSTWFVNGDSTVTNLNVAEGGEVVDESGHAVTIVANGETIVQGSSAITVTVEGTYSTSVDESGAATAQTDLIDRSGFDAELGTSTTYSMTEASATTASTTGTSSSATTSSSSTTASGSDSNSGGIWATIVNFFKSLFGLS